MKPAERVVYAKPNSWRRFWTSLTARLLLASGLSVLGFGIGGCVMPQATSVDQVEQPDTASVSPNMDFARISSVGIFPLFPAGQTVEDQQLSESLIAAITGETQQRQTQWKINTYRDLLGLINKANLGTGYKNLQADFNTFAGPAGQIVLSPPTKRFIRDLTAASGVDAYLIGSYTVGVEQRAVKDFLTGQQRMVRIETATARLSLYYPKDEQFWWNASMKRGGRRDDTLTRIGRTLAAHIGKGTLRQL